MPRFTSATIIAVPFSFRIVIAPATAERAADIREAWQQKFVDGLRTCLTPLRRGRYPRVKQNKGADMKRPLGACCLVAAGFLAILVQDVAAQIKGSGIGNTSCAQFADLYKETPENTETVFFAWAMGVMSGLNVSLRGDRADLLPHNFDADDQKAYIRRFCDERPSALYVEAVADLYATLRAKQSLPPWQFSRQRKY